MASERTTQTQTVQQAATNSDGEAPWADLEVAIPNDRDHASLVSLVECALIELTHEQVGAVVVTHQVCGDEPHAVRRRRRRRQAVPEAALRRPVGLAQDHRSSRDRSRRTRHPAHSVGSLTAGTHTRSSSQRAGHVHREAGSGTPDSITDTLNQHSGPVLAQCWLTTFQNSCPQPRPPPCSSTTLPLSAIAIRDRTDTAGCSCLSAPQAVQRATMSAA